MPDDFLRPARWKLAVALIVAILGLTPLASDIVGGQRLASHRVVGSAIIAVIGIAYAYFSSGRYIRFMREGFEVKERFRAGRYTLWKDVDDIGIACFPSSAGGRLRYQYFAGIKLRHDESRAMSAEHRNNREACGYEILLDANYGMAIERFIMLLKEKMREAKKG